MWQNNIVKEIQAYLECMVAQHVGIFKDQG